MHSVVDFNLHIPANAILAVTLLALLSSNLRFATERYWLGARLPVKMLVTLALVAGVAYLGCQGWRAGAKPSGWRRRNNRRFSHPPRRQIWKRPLTLNR